jgi:hypothetical protein
VPPGLDRASRRGDLSRMPRFAAFIVELFVKRFFTAKILCTYTMNYLPQEKSLQVIGRIPYR